MARNITILRATLQMTATELAELATANGRPLTRQAVSEIENLGRRCDIDDLMALAQALGVSPATLLMPRTDFADDEVSFTGGAERIRRLPAQRVWNWLSAQQPLDPPVPSGSASEDDKWIDAMLHSMLARTVPAWARRR